jgi:CysZ protein
MLSDALEALAQVFSPSLRKVMWKSLLLTGAVLLGLALCLDRLAASIMPIGPAWLTWVLSIVAALGLLAGAILLAPPTASLVAGFYLDDVAAMVEREIDPTCAPGVPPPTAVALAVGLRFATLSLMINLAVVVLTLFAGLGFAAFFLLNGYLLGREYFELIAMRHMPRAAAEELRRGNWGPVYVAGLLISGFVAVPILNLLTPLFAAAFMSRVVKRLAHTRGSRRDAN